jgi:type IV pilus assembly protein PilV
MQLSNLERARSRGACAAGSRYRRARGFSLMEVMVALVVSTIGLLGLAKMEALAMSSTGVASSRSLAAIEASSLAAAMHANPGYWQAGTAPASILISGTATTNPYAASPACTLTGTSSCTPQAMANNDLNQWAGAVSQVLPGYLATISCSQANFPVTCTIQLQWTENGVAVNTQQTQMSSLVTPTYVLFVQP